MVLRVNNIGLPQEIRKTSNNLNLIPKGARKKRIKRKKERTKQAQNLYEKGNNGKIIIKVRAAAAAAAKSLQLCPTLCNPIDGSPPGSPVPGILQARTLEWAAISFSNA